MFSESELAKLVKYRELCGHVDGLMICDLDLGVKLHIIYLACTFAQSNNWTKYEVSGRRGSVKSVAPPVVPVGLSIQSNSLYGMIKHLFFCKIPGHSLALFIVIFAKNNMSPITTQKFNIAYRMTFFTNSIRNANPPNTENQRMLLLGSERAFSHRGHPRAMT
jgi:hypothetical protein